MKSQKSTTDHPIQSTARSMLVREDFALSVQEAMLNGRAHWVVEATSVGTKQSPL